MKILEQITEDEFVAEFLKAEINSKRFGKPIIEDLKEHSKEIILNPNLKNEEENKFRKKLLGKVRGWNNKFIFEKFPNDIQWFKVIIKKQELEKVKYIKHDYWDKISDNTRLPIQAVKKINKGIEIFGESNNLYFDILSEIKKEGVLPRMIFVSKDNNSKIVVLEGHARLTAFFLESEVIPDKLEVIIGYSKNIENWDLY